MHRLPFVYYLFDVHIVYYLFDVHFVYYLFDVHFTFMRERKRESGPHR